VGFGLLTKCGYDEPHPEESRFLYPYKFSERVPLVGFVHGVVVRQCGQKDPEGNRFAIYWDTEIRRWRIGEAGKE
jgi:hypothetical protein